MGKEWQEISEAIGRHDREGSCDFLRERVMCLAALVAGEPLPALRAHAATRDVVPFLKALGVSPRSFQGLAGEVLVRAINDTLLRYEWNYMDLLVSRGRSASLPSELTIEATRLQALVSARNRRKLTHLVRAAAFSAAEDQIARLQALWARILQAQDPKEVQLPLLYQLLMLAERTASGVMVSAMQLELLARGLEVGPIRVAPQDQEVLDARLLVTPVGADCPVEVVARELFDQLQAFVKNVAPQERGWVEHDTRYRGAVGLLVAAMRHPRCTVGLMQLLMQTVGRILFTGVAGRRARYYLPRIVAAAVAPAQMSYLRILIRNRLPLDFKVHMAPYVTSETHHNAWQGTFELSSGERVLYAEALAVLSRHMSNVSNIRDREFCIKTLMYLGIPEHITDTQNTLQRLPASPICVLSNHESYLDIPMLCRLLASRRLSFVARDSLVYTTGAVGVTLASGTHVVITRMRPNMGPAESLRIYRKTMADFRKSLRDIGADLLIFPQGTRSRDGSFMAAAYRDHGISVVKLAKEEGVPIVPVHLHATGKSLMYERASLKALLGIRPIGPLRQMAEKEVAIMDTRLCREIRVTVGPVLMVNDPEKTMDQLIAFHEAAASEGATNRREP